MPFTLQTFEEQIDERILERGRQYFDDGRVVKFDELKNGAVAASVKGSELYDVRIEIAYDGIVDYECDCPFDAGPVCKHVVAVLFAMQELPVLLRRDTKEKKVKRNKSTVKKESETGVVAAIAEILEGMSPSELKELVLHAAEQEEQFREVLSRHAESSSVSILKGKKDFAKETRRILSSAGGAHGFIDWRNVRSASLEVIRLLDASRGYFRTGNTSQAVELCIAVIEEMTKALQFADDSNGDVAEPIHRACEFLEEFAGSSPNDDAREFLVESCLKLFRSGAVSDWDWHWEIIHIAAQHCTSKTQLKRILTSIQSQNYDGYDQRAAVPLQELLLRKLGDEVAAEKLIEKNRNLPNVRDELITKAIKKGELNRAKELAHEGIKHDAKYPGLVDQWYDRLLNVALKEKDNDSIIELARKLLIEYITSDRDYRAILKKVVPVQEWKYFIGIIIDEFDPPDGNTRDVSRCARLIIAEEDWKRLMHVVTKNAHLYTIEHYDQYLVQTYSRELALLYSMEIEKFLKNNVGRNHYRKARHFLGRMKKLNEPKILEKLISTLREQYAFRPALLDELNKLKV